MSAHRFAITVLLIVCMQLRCRSMRSQVHMTTGANQSATVPFSLVGLLSPAQVAGSVFVYAQAPANTASVTFYLDSRVLDTVTQPPFWMGGQAGATPRGLNLDANSPGAHTLRAVASLSGGKTVASQVITLDLVPSITRLFSPTLTPYANQPSAQQKSMTDVLNASSTPGATLTPAEQAVRYNLLGMYLNWGIDPSLDFRNDQSALLLSLSPTGWTPPADAPASGTPFSMLFSPDAPFYQPIPAHWPKTLLPAGYFQTLQINTTTLGDGLGFGQSVASPTDPSLTVTSQWYQQTSTHKTFPFPMPFTWFTGLPAQLTGDMHMIFVDPRAHTFVSTYKTSLDLFTHGPDALYASSPTSFNTLGDRGGSSAGGFAELPILLQPGEATDATHLIRHALGGSVSRVWAARVFPASAWDTAVTTSVNSCTHTGFSNTGLVPYGGVIQLDPALNLTAMHLTLPALRILQAIQTYGYYVLDFGCADLDIYTAISEVELEPFGGLWGYNRRGPGVQNEVRSVLMNNRLSVVAPLTRKQ